VNEQTQCPSCDSLNLELRTDRHMMCAACGYIFPEPVDALSPLDETPVSGLPRPDDWGDTEPIDVPSEESESYE
jgi:hypothetical protein